MLHPTSLHPEAPASSTQHWDQGSPLWESKEDSPALSWLAWLPSATTLAKLSFFALLEHQTHADLPVLLHQGGGEQQWGSQSAHWQLQAPSCSDRGAVPRLANKSHEGWHVMVQLFKWPALGPHQFNSIQATAERTTRGRNGPR